MDKAIQNAALQSSKVTSVSERFFYSSYFWGQNISYFIVIMMLQTYLTDVVGITAAAVATIFLFVRIWDAILDPFFGVIMDRANLKHGKFIPWIRLSAYLIPALTVLMFVIPNNLSYGVKVAWVAIAHLLWGTAYTICDAPIAGLSMAITNSVKERTSLISLGRLGALLAMLGAAYFLPELTKQTSYGTGVIVLSVLAFFSMLPIGYKGKERFSVSSDSAFNMRDIIQYLKTNKYLLIFLLALILGSTNNSVLSCMNYVSIQCLEGESAIKYNMFSFYGAMVAAVPVVMILCKYFDKFYIFIGSYVVTVVANIVMYFAGYQDLTVYYMLNIMKGMCFGFTMILIYTFVADVTIYGVYKTKIHAEGISFALQTFTQKMFTAIASSLVMFTLSAAGYISSNLAQETIVQPQEVVDTIWLTYNIFPAVGAFITLIILVFFYKLRDKHVKIMSEVNNGELSEAEAEKMLPTYL